MDAATRTGPVRILIVDDDASIRMLLEVNLEFDERFDLVASASSGSELLAQLELLPAGIDAVLVDVTLPDVDGLDLVAKLRARLPTAAIALYTGWSDPDLLDRAAAVGANGVFTKTGDTKTLFDELLTLVD
ncbi:MAG: response regulator transcription factor [Thermoleophilia bacterium]|nr:response regulator transcription factor [Thermoleophilia bacterium]